MVVLSALCQVSRSRPIDALVYIEAAAGFTDASVKAWHFVLGAGALAGAIGVVVAWRRTRESDAGAGSSLACVGDRACAVARAERVRVAAKARRDEGDPKRPVTVDEDEARRIGQAMRAALERDDCDAATELSSGLERLDVKRDRAPALADAIDDAVRGRLGYCATAVSRSLAAPPPGASVRLDRGGCDGPCAVYSLTVTARGDVTFEGTLFTAVHGVARATVPASRARELFDAFERLRFAQIGLDPTHVGAGNARATLTLDRGAVTTIASDGEACMSDWSIDRGVCYLENRTDEIAQSFKWVNVP